jgi:ABC-2 type transport system permease protein
MLRNVFAKTLRDQRRALTWWGIGLAAYLAVYVPFYTQYSGPDSGFANQVEQLPETMRRVFNLNDMTTPAGYLESTVFGLVGPLLVIMFASVLGARAIAGEEEAGTLDLLLAHPVSRRRFLLERFAALATAVLGLGVLIWVVTTALAAGIDMSIGADKLAAAVAGLALLGLAFGSLALTAGAFSGHRGPVLGVTAGVAVLAYAVNALAPQVDALEPLQKLSPFHYFLGGDPLRAGFQLGDLGILLGITLVLAAAALWAFDRRDVAV